MRAASGLLQGSSVGPEVTLGSNRGDGGVLHTGMYKYKYNRSNFQEWYNCSVFAELNTIRIFVQFVVSY